MCGCKQTTTATDGTGEPAPASSVCEWLRRCWPWAVLGALLLGAWIGGRRS